MVLSRYYPLSTSRVHRKGGKRITPSTARDPAVHTLSRTPFIARENFVLWVYIKLVFKI